MKKRTDSQARSNLIYQQARRCHQTGEISRAVGLYGLVLSEQPRHTDSFYHLAQIAFQAGNFVQATTLLNRLLQIDPHYSEAFEILWRAYHSQGKNTEAIEVLKRQIELRPRDAYGLFNLALLQQTLGNWSEARLGFEQSLRLRSDDPRIFAQYGNLLKQTGEIRQAAEAFTRALALDSRNGTLHSNLAYLLARQGMLEEALHHYDRAIALLPDNQNIRLNRMHVLFKGGLLAEGFAELERRLQMSEWQQIHAKYQSIPRWNGEAVTGKTLLVHHEQGFGETLQYARYLPMVKATGAKLVVAVPKPLMRLFSNLAHIDQVIEDQPQQINPLNADRAASFLSLPALFQTRLDTIPAHIPYLFADPFLTHAWSPRMDWKKLRVGLVWAAGNDQIDFLQDNRYLGLKNLLPLTELKNIAFYSLQKGKAAAEVQELGDRFSLIDAASQLEDFADTAALIANMDLIISVDTATAHLAAAMGRRVWTLLPQDASSRWLLDRKTSPWYSTMLLFRQQREGNWTPVIREVYECLTGLPGPHRQALPISRKFTPTLAEAALT